MNQTTQHSFHNRFLSLAVLAGVTVGGALSTSAAEANTPWDVTAALGLTLTRGNSSTLTFAGKVLGIKKWDKNEVNLGADATFGQDHGKRNAENYHAFGQYNRLLTDKWYLYGRADGYRDPIAELKYRVFVSPGVGYYFVKNDQTQLRVEGGPTVVFEKQGDKSKNYLTFRVAERLDHKFNEKTKLWQSLEFLDQVDHLNNYFIIGEIGIDTALTKKLSLQTYLQDTYHKVPAAGKQKNDLKLVTAVAYKF